MNLVNLQDVSLAYGPLVLLDTVSLGVGTGERIGVVGRNGGGKSTLMSVLAGHTIPDTGRVVHARHIRVGLLQQRDTYPQTTVATYVLGDWAEHEWAGNARIRDVLRGLLGGWDLDVGMAELSGGERRRATLARLLVDTHELLILDEPTNHLDLEAISWLAEHVRSRPEAVAVVTHDRWFLDAVTTHTWEIVDGRVERYEGGYAAYVLAKAERERLAAATEERRQNLMRKELAWLRRGAPARTSKPKFRVEAANNLIANEPPPRDTVELVRFASARLGKSVIDVTGATVTAGPYTLLEHLTWQLGPGDRVGVLGGNGSGKTSLLRLLAKEQEPTAGRVRHGSTVRLAHLSQGLLELDPSTRALRAVEEIRQRVHVGRREYTASQMMERFGFRGERQWTPVGELSGGERRRLQLLRLLMDEPNVLLLDEPTNDLDIETLTELEDLLDGWPGSLVLVSHDRYFLERITDQIHALFADGQLTMLPGGVEEYLRHRARTEDTAAVPTTGTSSSTGPSTGPSTGSPATGSSDTPRPSAAERRAAQKEVQRLERQLDRLSLRESELHTEMAEHSHDFSQLAALDAELKQLQAQRDDLEERWLAEAERME